MLQEAFKEVYIKFKLHFYQSVFGKFERREATLTTVETFCMETIHAMGSPTVAEFAARMNLSSPNAAYKINNLVRKGYLKKNRSTLDKREYHLEVTEKYLDYYDVSNRYLEQVIRRMENRFSKEEIETLYRILQITSDELMPEVELPSGKEHKGDTD